MKAFLTTLSSTKSSAATPFMEEEQSETRDSSCYYPGCRKDANCNCEICLASINATLDLMPRSIQKSSLTKLSVSRSVNVETTPVSFGPSIMSTPRSISTPAQVIKNLESPLLKSTARVRFNSQKMEKRHEERGFGCGIGVFWRLFLGLCLIFVVEIGFSWGVSGVLKPVLKTDLVKSVGERSWIAADLNGRLRFLQRELQGLVKGRVSNCSFMHSTWKISQDGLLLNSRCTLYKSLVEEVSIWGWPLQTAGLLRAGLSSRFFTILSGRVTEWPDGKIGYLIRKTNSSWAHEKWGASVVQLDASTWVLEYQQSFILENRRFFSIALEFLKHRLQRNAARNKQKFSFSSTIGSQYREKIPT